jgi:hypothetical protein
MSHTPLNLDRLAAQLALRMVDREARDLKDVSQPIETLERLVSKTLGVLQAQGVYSMILFLFSRTSDEQKVARLCVLPRMFEVLKEIPPFDQGADIPDSRGNCKAALRWYVDNVLEELDTLLLLRDLYEQTLIYARYGAKAVGRGA